MSLAIIRTDSTHTDFTGLVKLLDADLAMRDGPDHAFYSQFNRIDTIRHTIVAYKYYRPVGCGAVKQFSHDAMEIKRMFVIPEARNTGVATHVLSELEKWTTEVGYLKMYSRNRQAATGGNRLLQKERIRYYIQLRPIRWYRQQPLF